MRIAIAGGGPVGIFLGLGLARRGHHVTLVDRDPGPPGSRPWRRVGVMQFNAPHGVLSRARQALLRELPDVYDALVAAGAQVRWLPQLPPETAIMFCRRSVLESELRAAARRQPGLEWVTGHVDDVIVDDRVASGLAVDGRTISAEVVIVATGKNSHLGDPLRGAAEGGPSGFSGVCGVYLCRDPADACDLLVPSVVEGPGYTSMVMPSDAGHHSVLICYPARDTRFAALRDREALRRAAGAIPHLAPWCDAERYRPVLDVSVIANFPNSYRSQGPALGTPAALGLFFAGDAVATLNPENGLYLSLALPQAEHLMAALDDPSPDLAQVSASMDAWAEHRIRPWYLDHVLQDEWLSRRFAGRELDLEGRIPPDVIAAAADVDPSLLAFIGPYRALLAEPDILDHAQQRVRDMLRGGWRPPCYGPSPERILSAAGSPSRS